MCKTCTETNHTGNIITFMIIGEDDKSAICHVQLKLRTLTARTTLTIITYKYQVTIGIAFHQNTINFIQNVQNKRCNVCNKHLVHTGHYRTEANIRQKLHDPYKPGMSNTFPTVHNVIYLADYKILCTTVLQNHSITIRFTVLTDDTQMRQN
jgi:hypothetical protein